MRLFLIFLITAVSFFALGYKVNGWLVSEAALSRAMSKARDAVNAGMVQESYEDKVRFFWPPDAEIPLGFKSNIGRGNAKIPLNVGGLADRVIFYAKPACGSNKYVVVYDNATVGLTADEPDSTD